MKRETLDGNSENSHGTALSIFPHAEVEAKWRARWLKDRLYSADDRSSKPKFYCLDMYPYPSGSGLHVGHIEGYTASDILARYKRMNGFEVLHPMGWDAFGLPTENYAIKTGKNPHDVTAENVGIFRSQCMGAGFGIDWDREIDTSREDYYKWTQELFLILFKAGLAFKEKAPSNWCPDCKTVISNEQAAGGCCERCKAPVLTKKIEQWFFKTTKYADRLIQDLEKVDWPESSRKVQSNWIGRSEGRNIKFPLVEGIGEDITVFTTKPETLYGATFMAIAPEHPLVESLVTNEQKAVVAAYVDSIIPQTQIERKKEDRKKTGVFTGTYVQNPLTKELIPVWVADYVLMDYGTGVVMGVPAHDKRDQDFAEVYGLRSVPVIEPDKHDPDDLRKGTFLVGEYRGKRVGESMGQFFQDLGSVSEEAVQYKLKDWLVSRERYWGAPIPIINCEKCGAQPVPSEDLPVLLPRDVEDFKPTGVPPLAKSAEFMNVTCPHCEGSAQREAKTLDTFVDSAWYFLRFADARNGDKFADRALLDRWLPVDHYVGGAEHLQGHLIYARFIIKALYDLGYLSFDEPFISLKHPGIVLGEDGKKMSKRLGNVVNPEDVSSPFGADTLRLYEMFMGPLEQSIPWDSRSVTGPRKFVDRVWRLQEKRDESCLEVERPFTDALVASVTTAIETGRYNTAISDFMKYINKIDEVGGISKDSFDKFLKCLAPFAPFITEELWARAGNEYSIHQSPWPEVKKSDEVRTNRDIPVMVNGKLKGTILLPDGVATDEEVMTFLRRDPQFATKLGDLTVRKIVYKPGKVFSIAT